MHLKTKLTIAGLVLLVTVIFSAGLIGYSSTPRFCASCHLMETRYISWQHSDHAQVTDCLSCHSEPGPLGELKAHLAGIRYLYAFVTGRQRGPILLAEVPNGNCLKCHEQEQLLTEEPPARGEVHSTYHHLHLARQQQCTACHGGLAHATMLPVKARSAMSLCQSCHQPQSGPLRSCAQCHPYGPSGTAVRRSPRVAPMD